MDRQKLFKQAMTKFALGLIVVAALLFIPAGTLRYPNGWRLIIVLFVPMFIAGLWMLAKRPRLLKKRLNVREREREQRSVIVMSGVVFLASFIVAGLNYRFGWMTVPKWGVHAATFIFLLAYLMYGEVLRENMYLSRTVEIQAGQQVIDTGLYGVMRHPMYCATLLMFLSMPLILGSPVSFIIMLSYIPIIAKRIRNEERVLTRGLEGYREYKQRVRYKVIPYIW